MFLALPFHFLPMFWYGIVMTGWNRTFSTPTDKLPKPSPKQD